MHTHNLLDYHEIFIEIFTNQFYLSSQESKILLVNTAIE